MSNNTNNIPDSAIDNLWMTKDDVMVFNNVGIPKEMKQRSGNPFEQKSEKVQGYMVYFLPKDKQGKSIGKPQKFLRLQKLGKTINEFIPAISVTPYYEDVVKNKAKWISLGGANLVAKAESKVSGINQGAIASNFTAKGSELLNSNEDEFSNFSFNDFLNKIGISKSNNSAIKTISDPNVSIVDVKIMNQAHKESGSKMTFGDWIKSDTGHAAVNSVADIINTIASVKNSVNNNNGLQIGDTNDTGNNTVDNNPPLKTETLILGMSPVTFGIVSVAAIVTIIGGIVVVKMINKKS